MVKNLCLACVLVVVLTRPAEAQQWIESTTIGTMPYSSKGPFAVLVARDLVGWNDDWNVPFGLQPDTWNTIDLPVPPDTNAAFLAGLLVITHPTYWDVICEIRGTFRAPGSNSHEDNYQIQTLEAHRGGGVRSTVALWVPVSGQQTQFFFRATPGCPSLINLSLQAYVR
jgi:hypothetical protein